MPPIENSPHLWAYCEGGAVFCMKKSQELEKVEGLEMSNGEDSLPLGFVRYGELETREDGERQFLYKYWNGSGWKEIIYKMIREDDL